jgi:hypothetical protein
MLTVKLRKAYYFGVSGKCNFFVAGGIAVDFEEPRLDQTRRRRPSVT